MERLKEMCQVERLAHDSFAIDETIETCGVAVDHRLFFSVMRYEDPTPDHLLHALRRAAGFVERARDGESVEVERYEKPLADALTEYRPAFVAGLAAGDAALLKVFRECIRPPDYREVLIAQCARVPFSRASYLRGMPGNVDASVGMRFTGGLPTMETLRGEIAEQRAQHLQFNGRLLLQEVFSVLECMRERFREKASRDPLTDLTQATIYHCAALYAQALHPVLHETVH